MKKVVFTLTLFVVTNFVMAQDAFKANVVKLLKCLELTHQ